MMMMRQNQTQISDRIFCKVFEKDQVFGPDFTLAHKPICIILQFLHCS
jgi:hypothetical protein